MKQSLNFDWSYKDDFKEEYLTKLPVDSQTVDIPHSIKNVPYNYFDEKDYQKVVTYIKEFDIEEDIKNRKVILHFQGFMLQADIYLNDLLLGHFVSGYIPIDIDITDKAKQKGNKLIVVLDSREDKNYPPFGYAVDYLTFSGIYREVELFIHPKSYIKDMFIKSDMEGNTEITYTKVGNDQLDIHHELYDMDNNLVISSNEDKFKVEQVKLWDIKHPYLYTLKTYVKCQQDEEIIINKVGYRNIKFQKDGFYLNNERIKLLGLNRHQAWPYVGYAMPKSMQMDDADKLKALGLNVVRTSHYPQSEHFLKRCDEIGLMVINEIPGWQHISKEEIWRNQYYKDVEMMVKTERNHPSLIAHGVRIDESKDDHELYLKGNEIAHQLDPTRPTIGVRNVTNSELLEDIYGYNDFRCSDLTIGLINPKKVKKGNAPYLITEYMGHMQPHKPTSDIDRLRDVALRHALVINDARKYDEISGCIGWCFVDYYTHVDFGSGDHICNHGVLDMYRNPKYASYIYASQQDDFPVLEIMSNMRPGDFPMATYQDIYIATNADKVELYKNDEYVTTFYPKSKLFKYLKHPPIFVDDVLGETFKDERFNEKERKTIAKIFSYGGIFGFGELTPSMKLKIAKIYLKHHLTWDDLLDIWNTHIATWGGYAKTFTFKAIKDGKTVLEKRIAPSLKFHYEYDVPRTTLINDETYDVLGVVVKFVDEDNNVMRYANNALEVSCEGEIELIGPSLVSTLGGSVTIYIRSKKNVGTGKLFIKSDKETKVINFEVK